MKMIMNKKLGRMEKDCVPTANCGCKLDEWIVSHSKYCKVTKKSKNLNTLAPSHFGAINSLKIF